MALLVSHDACQLRRADYGKPGDPDRDQWFWLRGDTFALAVLLAFIMMQAQITTFAEAATLIPDWLRLRLYFLRDGAFFAITGALCAYLIVHIFAGTAETILAGVMALVNFESVREHVAMQHNTGWLASAW